MGFRVQPQARVAPSAMERGGSWAIGVTFDQGGKYVSRFRSRLVHSLACLKHINCLAMKTEAASSSSIKSALLQESLQESAPRKTA